MSIKFRKRAPLIIFFLHEIQQRIRSFSLRAKLQKILALWVGREKNQTDIESFIKDGYLYIDHCLSDNELDLLTGKIKDKYCIDRARPELGEFKIDNAPIQTHVADVNDILDIPEVLKLAHDPSVLKAVAAYLGCQPIIDNIKAWWSIPGHEEAENEQYYHRDNDTVGFVKLFIYLTDVTNDSGPHVYVSGSHRSNDFNERRRYQDDEVENSENSSIVRHTGSKGSCFLEDTWGLHKGSLPNDKKRLLLQVRYSILPTIFVSKFVVDQGPIGCGIAKSRVNKYIFK